eukprot:jgi/Botrbrau1/19380/Bobra.0338s0010.2
MAVVPPHVEDQINALVTLIRTHVNPGRAVEDALRAVINSSPDTVISGPATAQLHEEGPNLIAMAPYPKLCHMLGLLARHPVLSKKNTVTLLHEYATRTSLVVSFEDKGVTDSKLYHIDTWLTAKEGDPLYSKGTGLGRSKKEAKQLAAAEALELLLCNVRIPDLLGPSNMRKLAQGPQSRELLMVLEIPPSDTSVVPYLVDEQGAQQGLEMGNGQEAFGPGGEVGEKRGLEQDPTGVPPAQRPKVCQYLPFLSLFI